MATASEEELGVCQWQKGKESLNHGERKRAIRACLLLTGVALGNGKATCRKRRGFEGKICWKPGRGKKSGKKEFRLELLANE